MKGRKPKSTEAHIREGTWRPDRHEAPLVVAGRPMPAELDEPPDHLPDDGKRMWRMIVPDLVQAGVLDRVDVPVLEGLCTMYARACGADRVVAFQGFFAAGSMGQMREHPASKMSRESWTLFHRMTESFALTPVARARLGLAHIEFRRSLTAELERQLGTPNLVPADGDLVAVDVEADEIDGVDETDEID